MNRRTHLSPRPLSQPWLLLCSRATDGAGNRQPLEAPWNLGGYANTEVQRIPVVVTAA